MSDKKELDPSSPSPSTSTPSSESSSPASSKSSPPSTPSTSKPTTSSKDKKSEPSKRDSGGLSSLKGALEKAVPKVSSLTSDPAPSSSSTSSPTDWTSRLTLGLVSSKGKADLSDWLPDLSDRIPPNLFTQPPPSSTPFTPSDPTFPPFTSILPPPPPPSSALRYGWIDEYGDYHPIPPSLSSAKLNPKVLKAKEQAKDLISSILAQQERAEKDKDPQSPRMSTVVKEKLNVEASKDGISQGVDRLVQVVEGSKGEKKVVVTEEEKVQVDL